MINILVSIFSDIFDLILLYFYINIFLKENKKDYSNLIYCAAYIIVECIISLNSYLFIDMFSSLRTSLNIVIGIITTFCITLLYETKFSTRLFISISFQALCGIPEVFVAVLLPNFFSQVEISHIEDYEPYILIMTKILAFFLLFAIDIFWHRHIKGRSASYNLLLLLTPVITLIITILIPHTLYRYNSTCFIFLSLILLNIVNYYLLGNTLQVADLKEREKQLRQQINFQSEKYQQISTAYRNTRSLIHDTKKHFFYINDCLKNKQYDLISNYMEESLKIIEHNYSRINTGNLVIDAFISNYMYMAKQEAIEFSTNIQVVADNIPVKDYDLCVIIGNLMDNSITAARQIPVPYPRQIIVEIFTDKLQFIIHVKNTKCHTKTEQNTNSADNELYHGYGTTNIKNITEKYNGTYSCFPEDQTFETIIVIPILDNK